jgi:tagatose 1,6-diphosphate aldolase GatY/KbaY
MPLASIRSMLLAAKSGQYAVCAFNIENMEMAQAAISAAAELRSPVIIQTTPGTLKYAAPEIYLAMVRQIAAAAPVPVAMHLDHGETYEMAERCRAAGYTSLMIDGSKLPFEDNVALSCRVTAMAGETPVEAELGTVGGKEDGHGAAIDYTDPDKAAEFAARTGIFSFAVAIGTAHGVYKGEPRLDIALLKKIRAVVNIPLVLHGTSGVAAGDVQECIASGICKVNYATDLRMAYTAGVREALALKPDSFDPKYFGAAGREKVRLTAMERIRLTGSQGAA